MLGLGDCGECPTCGEMLEFEVSTETLIPHRCCTCRDTGFVRYTLRLSADGFGKAHVCPDCGHIERPVRVVAAEFERRTRVPMRFLDSRIDTWKTPKNGTSTPRARVTNFVSRWPPEKPFMVLYGTKGAGKTHLACGAIRALHELHGKVGRFWPVVDLLDRYRATFAEDRATETVETIDAEMRRTDLLVLDDFGTQKSTEWAEERLFRLIDERSRDLRPLLVTTNLSLNGLPGRVGSRLFDKKYGESAEFFGRDERTAP